MKLLIIDYSTKHHIRKIYNIIMQKVVMNNEMYP